MSSTTLKLEPAIAISDQQFFKLCGQNPELKFERSPHGELIIMAPTGGETGRNNATLIARFVVWNESYQLGVVFDSSTCFRLPQGGSRSPDVAWIKKERWDSLTPEQQRQFPPLCPDFVLELVSPTDILSDTRKKMQEYQNSGASLGWLINPKDQQVEIYPDQGPAEVLIKPLSLSGGNILPNFHMDLTWLWQD